MFPSSVVKAVARIISTVLLSAAVPSAPAVASPSVSILCANKSGSQYVKKQHPSKCTVFGPGGTFGGGVNLTSVRWTDWGRPTATARGIELGFHRPFSHIPVRVVVTGRRAGRCGTVYTRMTVTSSKGTTRLRLKTCPGRTS